MTQADGGTVTPEYRFGKREEKEEEEARSMLEEDQDQEAGRQSLTRDSPGAEKAGGENRGRGEEKRGMDPR